jgi:hypothetical protein
MLLRGLRMTFPPIRLSLFAPFSSVVKICGRRFVVKICGQTDGIGDWFVRRATGQLNRARMQDKQILISAYDEILKRGVVATAE